MKTFTINEIKNKHGQFIAYWSKQPGSTELEKYKNFIKIWDTHSNKKSSKTEFVITDNDGNDITCFVDKEEGPNGHILVCFNNLGETILNTDDCYSNDEHSIKESLYKNV
jgi:glycosidase